MNNKNTYLFYDIETTGLNKCFDQVLQFAAIRTDLQLNEIDRIEIKAKINPDVIPSPAAVITHRIGPAQFTQGISEFNAIKQIHQLMNTPKTISVGYNTLGFDDEFLRFSFYKNLLSPYTHQYANGCSRMDIYPIAMLYYLFKPNVIEWPSIDGKTSLKLENINTANNLATGQAHDAMVDVEATVELAKRLIKDQSMWRYVTEYFNKAKDDQRISDSDSSHFIGNTPYRTGLLAYGKLGAKNNYIAPVIHCGQHQHYKNQSLWLRLDQENPLETPFVIKKRLAEPPLFLPIKDRYLAMISADRKMMMEKNLDFLANNATAFQEYCQFHQKEKYPVVPETDVDAALYNIGFPTTEEDRLFQKFHTADDTLKAQIASKITNPIRQEQAIRILGRHFPNTLNKEQMIQFEQYLSATPVDFKGEKKLTKENALQEINLLQSEKNLDQEQKTLLQELSDYLQ